jgi:hypothetical protein
MRSRKTKAHMRRVTRAPFRIATQISVGRHKR